MLILKWASNNDIKQSHHIREFVATQIQPLQLCQSMDGPEGEYNNYYNSI